MTLKIIACVNADNNLAGFKPPKRDLQRFAALTIGGTVVMGRKTWETIPATLRPLKHRCNVVVSRSPFPGEPGIRHEDSLAWSLDHYPESWVIGGGEIYRQALHLTRYIYLSRTRYRRVRAVPGDRRRALEKDH